MRLTPRSPQAVWRRVLPLNALSRIAAAQEGEGGGPQAGSPVHFKAEKLGFVTLVMKDKDGNRAKNLVFDRPVQAGDNMINQ